ncbi:hypothetical protein [Acinetobacter colistiniresistens]|uniref:hypothetical protein n=1 Tax=Acinetobacter colistiniresistens TaxID=280145 RepID=UPI00124FCEFD|nr:hypothetical protein [Acinetobacter colistiniresistens]
MENKPKFYQIEENKRQTGRTARMLVDAINAAMEGRAVYVLCPREAILYTKDIAAKICKAHKIQMPETIKFESLQSIGEHNINWKDKKLMRAHPNCKLFIDHHIYTQLFGHILDGYHEYDGEGPRNFMDLQLKRVPVREKTIDYEEKFWSQNGWNKN